VREDSAALEANVHYPTNNSLMWGRMKTTDRLLLKLREETGGAMRVRNTLVQTKNSAFGG